MTSLLSASAPRLPSESPRDTPYLEARGVSISLGGKQVIRGVDLAVRRGEVLAIVGPNGAGKSTLFGILSGDLTPDTGALFLDGAPLAEWSTDEQALRRSVLLQHVGISFPFRVVEVVRLARTPWQRTSAAAWDDDVIAGVLDRTDMTELADRVYMSLSGGERARAAAARVFAQEAVAVLLDEPTASLDMRHQELLLRLIRELAERGDAVAVVLHDLALAAAHADKVVLLHDGAVVAAGAPRDVFTPARLSQVYGHPVDVFDHPRTGELIVMPDRRRSHADVA